MAKKPQVVIGVLLTAVACFSPAPNPLLSPPALNPLLLPQPVARPPLDPVEKIRATGTVAGFVVRIICPPADRVGSGWIHRSGRVVTAAHVVAGCRAGDLKVYRSDLTQVEIREVAADEWLDLALLTPKEQLPPGLALSTRETLGIGDVVVTWGYPWGYLGKMPLLTVGHISGLGPDPDAKPRPVARLFVNAAFNAGNSGGPLVDVESQAVIGVVCAKLAPIPRGAESALTSLENQTSGILRSGRDAQGREVTLTEGQVVAMVLRHLRGQVQLVVGMAVLPAHLHEFLKAHAVSP